MLLETLVAKNSEMVISGVFAYPLDEKWLGARIDPPVDSSTGAVSRSNMALAPQGREERLRQRSWMLLCLSRK